MDRALSQMIPHNHPWRFSQMVVLCSVSEGIRIHIKDSFVLFFSNSSFFCLIPDLTICLVGSNCTSLQCFTSLLGTVLEEYRPLVFFVPSLLSPVHTVKTSHQYCPSTDLAYMYLLKPTYMHTLQVGKGKCKLWQKLWTASQAHCHANK